MRAWLAILIIRFLLRKEVREMKRKKALAIVYAYLIIDGFTTFEEVFDWLKPHVKEALIKLGCGHLAGVDEEGEN